MSQNNERAEDIRAYIFALFEVDADKDNNDKIYVQTRRFLGTGFFVSPKGDALTAAHVLPDPSQWKSPKRVVAALLIDGKQELRFVQYAASLPDMDVVIFKVANTESRFFEVDDSPSNWGDDFVSCGVPDHEVRRGGKEMRILKGHISMVSDVWELSVPIPAGMSGSPVFIRGKVAGVALGYRRSESIDDYHEAIEKISNYQEQITIAKTVKVIEYGTAFPFENISKVRFAILDDKGLLPFIKEQIAGHKGAVLAAAM